MEFNTLKEFKSFNKVAHDSLIDLWEQLSRTSRETARRDLRDNFDDRYSITRHPSDKKITFSDHEAGDTYFFDEVNPGEWTYIALPDLED